MLVNGAFIFGSVSCLSRSNPVTVRASDDAFLKLSSDGLNTMGHPRQVEFLISTDVIKVQGNRVGVVPTVYTSTSNLLRL